MARTWTENQKKAINYVGKSIIVSAGAGSGKTAVLTERVITKVKKGIGVNRLLILTFTKKAASEMKERIRKSLIEIGEISQANLIDSSYITTFDSFSLSIVKRYQYAIGVKKDIDITSMAMIIVKAKELINEIFDELYLNDIQFQNMVSKLCMKDDQTIKEVILKLYFQIDNTVNKDDYLNNIFSLDTDDIVNKFLGIIKVKCDDIITDLERLKSYCDNETVSDITKHQRKIFEATTYNEYLEALRFSIPRKKNIFPKEYSAKKEEINSSLEKLKKMMPYNNKDMLVEELKKIEPFNNVFRRILKSLDIRLYDYKNRYDLYTFKDIAFKAIEIVKNNEQIRKELTNEFLEIMIDEYQDTSDVQEEFISLIANNNVYMVGDAKQSIYGFRDANPELFRRKYNSFVSLTDIPYTDNLSVDGIGYRIDLLDNFRSRKEVVNTINSLFSILMTEDIGGLDYSKDHKMNYGNHMFDNPQELNCEYNYETEFLEIVSEKTYPKPMKEAFAIGRDILNKMKTYKVLDKEYRKIEYNDFAILIDRTTNFALFKKIFEYLNIPLSIEQDESIYNDYNLTIIVNILKLIVLVNKTQEFTKDDIKKVNYLYTSIARSYLFATSDNEIFEVIKNSKVFETEILKIVYSISDNLNTKSLRMVIDEVVNKFRFDERIFTYGGVTNLNSEIAYLQELATNTNYYLLNLESFTDVICTILNKKIKQEYRKDIKDDKGVHLMTIHKSKGLQFPIVYCCGLSVKFNESDKDSSFLFTKELGIVTPYFNYGIQNSFLKDIIEYDFIYNDISEKIRLFYVMLTRAQEKLIFVSDELDSNDFEYNLTRKLKMNSFKKMLEMIMPKMNIKKTIWDDDSINASFDFMIKSDVSFDNYITESSTVKVDDFLIRNPKSFELVNKNHYSKVSYSVDEINTKKVRDYGTMVHEFFECCDFISWKNDINYRQKFKNFSYLFSYMDSFLSSLIVKDIEKASIYKEYEFIEDDTIGIIDLMLIYNDKIDIIDYKLKNITDVNYIKQLNGYKDYVNKHINKDMTKKVNIYLYSILTSEYKEL